MATIQFQKRFNRLACYLESSLSDVAIADYVLAAATVSFEKESLWNAFRQTGPFLTAKNAF
jgi:hypothetical protein